MQSRRANATKPRIRPATPADTDFILSLAPRFVAFKLPRGRRKRGVLAAIRADIERALSKAPPNESVFVATNPDDTPVGFVRLQLQRDFFSGARACHVSDLAVAPERDGEGIGGFLLEHAHRWATRRRCTLLTLSVFPANTRARTLYERAGFAPELVRMVKPLR